MKRLSLVITIFTLLLSSLALLPGAVQVSRGAPAHGEWLSGLLDAPPGPEDDIYFPFLFRFSSGAANSITGKVVDQANQPVEGVIITNQLGNQATTGADGSYTLERLPAGNHILAAEKAGLLFSPSIQTVQVSQQTAQADFTAVAAELLTNGNFEANATCAPWEFPATPSTAVCATDRAFSGSRSARTGVFSPNQVFAYSSVRQRVSIPAGQTSVMLSAWLLLSTTEATAKVPKPLEAKAPDAAFAYDTQYILVLNQFLQPVEYLKVWRENDIQWKLYTFNLTPYSGQTIYIEFGSYNDGYGGVTSMYVDDVSLLAEPGNIVVPPGPTTPCNNNVVLNPSFELKGYWGIPATAYSAGYSNAAAATGAWSMRTGIVNAYDNRYSYSDAYQLIYIPWNATSATLEMMILPQSNDVGKSPLPQAPAEGEAAVEEWGKAPLASDVQYVLVLNQWGYIVKTLYWNRTNSGWTKLTFNMNQYIGQTIRLQFGTYNDGWSGITSMYVDDVTLDVCPGPGTAVPTSTPTPTLTPTPTTAPTATAPPTPTTPAGVCTETLLNGNFESYTGWYIPITAYSAGYSNLFSRSPLWSMRAGVYYPAHNRYSYSDFGQVVSIPFDAKTATLSYYYYPISTGWAKFASTDRPTEGNVKSAQALSTDVQYLLVLDWWGNWIDTLRWERSNLPGFSTAPVVIPLIDNLRNYRGWTIRLQWGVYNNGWDGVTSMFVDDASLQICR